MIIKKPQEIPQISGVYFFKNSKGEILYIGKAGNLKNRLSSYFSRTAKEPRTKQMLEEAESVEWTELGSEIEALITEAELIKLHQPPFNVALKDGKNYSYVAFSDDTFPRVYITHQPQENELTIGPFTDGSAIRSALAMFRRVFPFCSCKSKHNRYCLNYHIGKCPGFCCLKEPIVTEEQIEEYKTNIRFIKGLFRGTRVTLVKELETEMAAAAEEEHFEKAIELRDKIEQLKSVFENAKVIREIAKKTDILAKLKKTFCLPTTPRRIEGYDIANIQGKYATGAMVVFTDGNPDKNEYKKFKIRFTSKGGDTAMLAEILRRRFRHPEWQYPDLIIIDGGKAQLNSATSTLNLLDGCHQANYVIALTKNEKHIGDHLFVSNKKAPIPLKNLPESVRNLILQVDAEAHRFAIGYYRKLHRVSIER